jgi:hypothetical protein
VATFVILARELGVRDLFKAIGVMLVAVLIMGALQNLIL